MDHVCNPRSGYVGIPSEARAPLVIYRDTELTGAIAFQFLKSVLGRDSQLLKLRRVIDHPELSPSGTLHVQSKLDDTLSVPDWFWLNTHRELVAYGDPRDRVTAF